MKPQNDAVHCNDNPLLQPWRDAFGAPPFARIRPEHFLPAFAHAFAEHKREVQAVANNAAEPSFAKPKEEKPKPKAEMLGTGTARKAADAIAEARRKRKAFLDSQ